MEEFSGILKVIKQIRRRMTIMEFLRLGCFGGTIGFLLGGLLNFLAIWFPIPDAGWLGLGMGVLGILAGAEVTLFRRPGLSKAALCGDARGLKEGLITALERRDKQDPLSRAQREQTAQMLENFPVAKKVPIKIPYFSMGILLTGALFLFLCVLIPSPAKEVAAAEKELQALVKEQTAQIEELEKEIAGMEQIDPESQEAMMDLLEQTLEELRSMEDEAGLDKIMERLSMKLVKEEERRQEEYFSEMTQMARESLSLDESIEQQKQSLAEAAESQYKEQYSESGLTDEMKEALQNAAESYSENGLEGEQLTAAAETLGLTEEELTELLENAQAQIKEGGLQLAGNNEGNNENGNGENGNGENGNGESGTAQGGGADNGSKTGFEKTGLGTTTQEELHIPQREVGNDENLTGSATGEASYYTETDNGLSWNGVMKDYRQVAGEYTQEAYKRITSREVPDAVKDIVKNYFSGLAD